VIAAEAFEHMTYWVTEGFTNKLTGRSITFGDPDRLIELVVAGRKVSYLPRGHEANVVAFAIHDASACAGVLGGPLA